MFYSMITKETVGFIWDGILPLHRVYHLPVVSVISPTLISQNSHFTK